MMKMKHVVLAMAATGMLSGQALAVEGWDAEAPGVQPVQAALAGTEAALPEQVALVVQEPAAQVVEYSAKLPAVLPELPAALAVAEPAPFSAADLQALFVPSTEPLRVAVLSAQEMEETQGAVAPLVAIGVMHAGRFIATRYVSQSLATRMVQSGSRQVVSHSGSVRGVMAATAQQANQIAGRGAVREFHAGSGARFTHFHPASRNGAHVWFGRRR
ncbi:hypothetical protein [Serpentinimonas maccroryi]|uniref:hypothetical protein n=1 Tax=Serpentinimonas maccroryi TaxID=1458426 RepID=UPI0020338E1D|nr:hypothetical protein [Serpentinimonas maccroryi]MCM2479439.1 hypothetical protein [Serpentinimonas maccroryi]